MVNLLIGEIRFCHETALDILHQGGDFAENEGGFPGDILCISYRIIIKLLRLVICP